MIILEIYPVHTFFDRIQSQGFRLQKFVSHNDMAASTVHKCALNFRSLSFAIRIASVCEEQKVRDRIQGYRGWAEYVRCDQVSSILAITGKDIDSTQSCLYQVNLVCDPVQCDAERAHQVIDQRRRDTQLVY